MEISQPGQNFLLPITVINGGTGRSSFTPYAVITGGTTSTGALQNVSGLGTSGQVLTSNGASTLPTWQTNGNGNVVGPASSTATAVPVFADTTGKLLANSSVTIDGGTDINLHSGKILNGGEGTIVALFTDSIQISTAGAVSILSPLSMPSGSTIKDAVGGFISIDPFNRQLVSSNGITQYIDWSGNTTGVPIAFDSSGNIIVISSQMRFYASSIVDNNNLNSFTPNNRLLTAGDGSTVMVDFYGSPNLGAYLSFDTGFGKIDIDANMQFNAVALYDGSGLLFMYPSNRAYYASDGSTVLMDLMGTPNAGAAISFNGQDVYFLNNFHIDNGTIIDGMLLSSIDTNNRNLIAPDGVTTMLNWTGTYLQVPSIGANAVVTTDGSSNLVPSGVTTTEISFLSGVSSNIQTQLNAKANFPFEKSTNRSTGQTGAKTLTAFTVGGADASFIISSNVNITSSTLYSFTVTCTYTDETNTSRTLTLNFSQLSGTFVQTLTNALGAGVYEGVPMHIRCKAGTTITIASVGTFTTLVYNIEQSIIELN